MSRSTALFFAALGVGLALLVALTQPLGYVVELAAAKGFELASRLELLLVPVGATAVVLLRTLVGVEGFGVFSPLVLAFAFARTGVVEGGATFLAILAVATPLRILLDRVLILSVARTGILVALCAVGLFVTTALGVSGGDPSAWGLPVVIMAGIVDRFVTAQMDQSAGEAAKLSAYTIVSATLVGLLFGWGALRDTIARWPDLVLLSLPICLAAGRYTGLRLTERLRFRALASAP